MSLISLGCGVSKGNRTTWSPGSIPALNIYKFLYPAFGVTHIFQCLITFFLQSHQCQPLQYLLPPKNTFPPYLLLLETLGNWIKKFGYHLQETLDLEKKDIRMNNYHFCVFTHVCYLCDMRSWVHWRWAYLKRSLSVLRKRCWEHPLWSKGSPKAPDSWH